MSPVRVHGDSVLSEMRARSVRAEDILPGSPGWWSGNSEVLRSTADAFLVKVPRAHAPLVSFDDNHGVLREMLFERELGPEVLGIQEGVVCQRDLGPEWHVATFTRLRRRAGLVPRVIALHRDIAAASVSLTSWTGMQQLARLRMSLAEVGAWSPPEVSRAERILEQVGDRLDSGLARVAFLGDASTSNVMLHSAHEDVRAVGGTLAVAADPLQVAGALIAELVPFFGSAEEIFTAYWGARNPAAFSRACLYALLEDVKWTYVSRIAAAPAVDSRFNSSVYSFVRARHADYLMKDKEYRQWLEHI